jgi:probable HAF family extracellular repeat protein
MDEFTVDHSGCRRLRKGAAARCWALARNFALGLLLAIAYQSALAQAMYRMTDLGALGGVESYGFSLNASGQATGFVTMADGSYRGFIWKNNGTPMQDLGTLGGAYTQGFAINSKGQVTGLSFNGLSDPNGIDVYHAFIWKNDGTPMQDLGTLGGTDSQGVAINDSGQVTGIARAANNNECAFVWKNDGTTMQNIGPFGGAPPVCQGSEGLAINAFGQITGEAYAGSESDAFLWKNNGTPLNLLGTLGGSVSRGYAINDSGQVTGYSFTAGDAARHAFLWRNDGTKMVDLGSLGGETYAFAINRSGQVAGFSYLHRVYDPRAFVWKNDGTLMMNLGTLGGNGSFAEAINNSGQITGNSLIKGNSVSHAFLWRNDGTKMQDLNKLIDPADPLRPYVTLTGGNDINDASQILAIGTDSRTGQSHAYFLQGTILTLQPRTLGFSSQKVSTISAAQSVTVTNTSANAVAIASVTLVGGQAGQFSETNNCGKSLGGKAKCTIKAVFKPTTKGAKAAILNLNGGGGGLRSVALTGTGK